MTKCKRSIANEGASINSAVCRQSSIFHRPLWVPFIILSLLPLISCGQSRNRRRLAQDKVFIEILKRENRRWIGEDKFFETCLLRSVYPEVRRWSALALGRIASPRALPLLCKALRTGDAAVRAASAFAIGEIEGQDHPEVSSSVPDPETITELIRVLDDPSIIVRTRAVEALGKIGSQSGAVEIIQRLKEFHSPRTPAERVYLRASIAALGKIGDPIAVPVIGRLLDTGDRDIKREASDAISRIGAEAPDPAAKVPARRELPISPTGSTITDIFCRVLASNRQNSTIARLETNRGAIEIELFREDAPVTVAQFVLMATGGAYSGMEFASVVPHRLIEGIGLKSRAGATRAIAGEVNMEPFERGSVGMGMVNGYSETGHFFIALTPQPYLDGMHTCFGRVISGMPIADRIVPGDHIRQITIKETLRSFGRQ